MLKVYGFPTQNNGCSKYRVWDPLRAIQEQGLAEVDRDPDDPQPISIERAEKIFNWADVVYCQPFSQLWAACIFVATRDETKKKLIVDLDDNVWAIHEMNIGTVAGAPHCLKSHFNGDFRDFWELKPIEKHEKKKYERRIDGTVVKHDDGSLHFLKNKAPDVKTSVEFLLKEADAVTTTNPVLADLFHKFTGKPVFVMPNCLDLRLWKKSVKAPKPCVGWCGSVSHYPDLEPLMPDFDRLMKRYQDLNVEIMGSSFDYLFPLKPGSKMMPIAGYGPDNPMFYAYYSQSGERWPGRMAFHAPVPTRQYEPWMAEYWESHIGIAPLERNDFNDSRSELKWLEYTALGVPTVASDFGPYKRAIRDGEDGILVKDSWEDSISLLLDNPNLGERIAAAATERLHQEYDLNKRAKDWMNIYEEVTSSVPACT